jgi:hypothetical protein
MWDTHIAKNGTQNKNILKWFCSIENKTSSVGKEINVLCGNSINTNVSHTGKIMKIDCVRCI